MPSLKSRIASAFYLERVHEDGSIVRPRGVKRPIARLNQALAERGVAPPWALSRERCQAYWEEQANADTNEPANYFEKDLAIVDFLHGFWNPEVGTGASVLELGPNAGPNLERLRLLGYGRLGGVEINPAAIEAMKRVHPELRAEITIGPMEEALPEVPTASWDVVFTMGVAMHVHPTSRGVFAQMVRIAGSHVAVVEPETAANSYVFARNYGRVFERLGCRELRSVLITADSAPAVHHDYHGCTARLFEVPRSFDQAATTSPAGATSSA